jgi:ribonuclease BN (tRNA processing enzyme)
MDVMVLPSALGGGKGQPLSSYLINGRLAVDAGSLGLFGSVKSQSLVTDVLLTHSHLDHVAGLPVLIDNVYDGDGECPTVRGPRETIECLRRDVFNGCLYPDMLALSERMPPFVTLSVMEPRRPTDVAGLTVTAVPVNHVVPTFAYVIRDRISAVAIVTDTAPTEEVWDVVRDTPGLAAVFLEASFPESERELAAVSKHLTTGLFAEELAKLPPGVPVFPVHIKPRYYAQVVAELKALRLRRLVYPHPGRVYRLARRARRA